MKVLRTAILILISSCVGGCVRLSPPHDKPLQPRISGPIDYHRSDLKSVTEYAGYVAGLTGSERKLECNRLIQGEEGDLNSVSIRLHIVLVMILSPECGGMERALMILVSIRDRELPVETSPLFKYLAMLANDLIAGPDQNEILEQKIDTLETKADSLEKRLKKKDKKLDRLQGTLEALKQIEKSFHQRDEFGVP